MVASLIPISQKIEGSEKKTKDYIEIRTMDERLIRISFVSYDKKLSEETMSYIIKKNKL